jgi:addiction module HigA family antidote
MIRVHPGKILADEMRARALSANALALKLRVPANRITEIVNGKRSISLETAIRLGHYFRHRRGPLDSPAGRLRSGADGEETRRCHPQGSRGGMSPIARTAFADGNCRPTRCMSAG